MGDTAKTAGWAGPVEPDLIEQIFVAAPGTEVLMDEDTPGATESRFHRLQHATVGNGHILLVPQPSLRDPNDPLRWPTAAKWAVLLNGMLYSFLGAATGPMMAAGMEPLSKRFATTLTRISYTNGAALVCQGVGNVFWMPLAIKYGRRPVYLASNLLMGLACVWLAVAAETTYVSFLLGRLFLGLWQAPIEAIVPTTITDIFYLHERGAIISLYGLAVLGGNEIGPLVSAYIIQSLNLRWAFWILSAFIGFNMVTMVVYMPETRFSGPRPVVRVGHGTEKEDVAAIEGPSGKGPGDVVATASAASPDAVPKRTYLQSLAFFSGSDPTVSLRRAFLRPFVLMAYPTVLWSSIIYGLSLGWNVILGSTVGQLFAPPPYNFGSGAQGLVFLSPLVGSLIGTYLCGSLADRIANWATKRNHGIREPEMRLPACLLAVFLVFVGALISALTYNAKTHWAGPVVGFGVLSAGAQMGATLSMSYSLDSHKELSGELMVTISCLKSLLAWIWTWVTNDWLAADGILVVFLVVAAINVVAFLTTFVFYSKGKAIRIWIREKDFLRYID